MSLIATRRVLIAGIIMAVLMALVAPVYAQDTATYSVQDGDTLGEIAREYCTTWTEIYESNQEDIGEDPNMLWIGVSLSIVNQCETDGATGGPVDAQSTNDVFDRGEREYAEGTVTDGVYRVSAGDTVFSIAERFGLTSEQLWSANEDLQEQGLKAGTTITIPEVAIATVPTTDEVTQSTETDEVTQSTETDEVTQSTESEETVTAETDETATTETEETATTETEETVTAETDETATTETEETTTTESEETTATETDETAEAQTVTAQSVIVDKGASEYAGGTLNADNRYVVSQGDTMFSIAVRFGIPIDVMWDANEGASNRGLYAGEHLIIPGLTTLSS